MGTCLLMVNPGILETFSKDPDHFEKNGKKVFLPEILISGRNC
jgi:hypothetical protein